MGNTSTYLPMFYIFLHNYATEKTIADMSPVLSAILL